MISIAAGQRLTELEPQFVAEFGTRPILTERSAHSAGNGTTLPEIEAWFLRHGIVCRVYVERRTLAKLHQQVEPYAPLRFEFAGALPWAEEPTAQASLPGVERD